MIYLDCNATSPIEPEVAMLVRQYMEKEFGNSGSRTHQYGVVAKSAVERAREQVAEVVNAQKDEVVFTSGATESNNLAILGLSGALKAREKTHVITTAIEHKAVLEPCVALEKNGFDVTYLQPDACGAVTVDQVQDVLTRKTGLISIMQVNNETGVIQPISQIADSIDDFEVYFHVDAAQGFGKLLEPVEHERIDMISVSGHKIYGPKGVGALITRRRKYKKPPLKPLVFGGGQEKGLRPGTLPVPLIAGFGLAAELSKKHNNNWWRTCEKMKESALAAFTQMKVAYHGRNSMPNTLNFSIDGINSEAAIIALKDIVAISNGSACTSSSYASSHVLKAMGLTDEEANQCIRISWCHLTPEVDWKEITDRLSSLY